MTFSHFDPEGRAVMVDVSGKEPTLRTAVASAKVQMSAGTLRMVLEAGTAKGDVLSVARLAGIAAAKKTPDLIPLAHPLSLHSVSVDFYPDVESGTIRIETTVKAFERTGVEMEAMTAASVAALAVYDMCKGKEKGISIVETVLLYKAGGRTGVYHRGETT